MYVTNFMSIIWWKIAGGACGYGSLVDVKPFRARVGAVSPVLFKGGVGCGACYKVKCLDHNICSRRAVTIIVTDECPGGYCSGGRTHFDLSGAAFGRMAVAGNNNQLRDRGEISVIFRRYLPLFPFFATASLPPLCLLLRYFFISTAECWVVTTFWNDTNGHGFYTLFFVRQGGFGLFRPPCKLCSPFDHWVQVFVS